MKPFGASEEKRKEKLAALQKKEEEDLTQILAQKYKIPYLNLSRITIDIDSLKIVPEKDAGDAGLAIIQSVGKKLKIAVKNPTLPDTQKLLRSLEEKQYTYTLFLVSIASLKRAWERYQEIPSETTTSQGIIDISEKRIKEFSESLSDITDFKELLKLAVTKKISIKASEVLEIILAGALKLEASDIHLEPEEQKVMLRLRLDGVLREVRDVEHAIYKLLLSRIKLISELKLNIHDRSQDGRFTIRAQNTDIEVRTSVLPGPYGESTVLRLLHPKTIALTLENLGMQPLVYQMMERELKKPNGMVLTTGPTGSGKTTTLYAFIKKIQSPGTKIITIENPIEYHIEGITQTQVTPSGDYTFAKGLSAILRQDPDIILVGEIRDFETAETAMHAALTGHLVFSTLHTNNAPGTIPRLIDIGVKPNIIAPAINIAMAQRLVRRLCENCKRKDTPTKKEQAAIETALKSMPALYKKEVMKKMTTASNTIEVFRATGCNACNNIGYKGRIGIFEAFLIDDAIEKLILENPSEAEIRKEAKRQGMLTLLEDGVLKVLKGMTSMEELERVAGEE